MRLESLISKVFQMDEETWRRHANPWSGWTRLPILPLLVLAVWSRVWLEWWSLLPIFVLLLWTWLNPRVFPPAESTEQWMSKGVLGERVWTNRDRISVPEHHKMVPNLLLAVAGVGTLFVMWGLAVFAVWPTVLGTFVAVLGKMWYVDRMVWLYEDTQDDTSASNN